MTNNETGYDGNAIVEYNSSVARRDKFIAMQERHYPPTKELLIKLFQGCRVLDFGCGPEGTLHFLGKAYGTDIVGLDYDRGNAAATYHSWDEVEGHYDYVIFSHVLEHMHYPESIANVERALTVAAGVVIVVPNGYYNPFINQRGMEITHVSEPYSNPGFCVILEDNGVFVERVIRSDIYDKRPFHIWAARFLFNGLLGYSPFYDYIIICRRKNGQD